MTERLNRLVALSVLLLVLAGLLQPALAVEPATLAPSEYTAVYKVLRNVTRARNGANLPVQVIALRGKHVLGIIRCAVSRGFRTDQ